MAYDYRMFEKLCELHNVTAYRVAQATGVTTATLSSWKLGRYEPKSDKIEKIADYFHVTPAIFQNKEEDHAYYIDAQTAAIAQRVFESPELRMLFDAAADCDPHDIQLAADMLKRFKETNPDG